MRVRRRWLATRATIAAIAANVIRQASLLGSLGMTVIMTPVNAPAVHRKTLKMEATRFRSFVSGPSRPDTHPQAPKRRAWEALTWKPQDRRLYPHINDTSLEKPYVLTVPYLKARSNACSKVRDVMITPRSRF